MESDAGNSYTSDSERPDDLILEKELERGAAVYSPATPDAEPTKPSPEPQPLTNAPSPIPDGGMQAWLQVLGSWCILVATWGLVNTYGVYQTYYETELFAESKSSSDISWVGSLQASLLLLVGVVSGALYDAGYFLHLIVAGLFLIVFGQFMTSLASEYWQVLLSQGICIGLGMGLAFLPSAAILSQYFSRHRALAIGIASSGSPIAGIIFPIIFSHLQPRVGFAWATRVIAFVMLALSTVPIAFMRTRLPPTGRVRQLVDPSALRDSAFMLFVAGCFGAFLTLYVAFFYIQLFAVAHGLSTPTFAPYLVTLLNVGSVLGRLVPNAIADKAGALNVLVVVTVASAVLMFSWLGIHSQGGLVAFALLYGSFSGGLVSLTPSVVVGLSPNLGRVGSRMGTMCLLAGTSVLVGTPIGGAILGDFSEARWRGVIAYGGCGMLLGAIFWAWARFIIYRRKGGVKA